MSIAHDLRIGRGKFLEGCQRLLGAAFLNDPQHRIQHHDCHDRRGFHIISQQGRDDGGNDQQDHNKIIQLFPQHLQEGRTRRFLQLIGAIMFQTLLCFLRS